MRKNITISLLLTLTIFTIACKNDLKSVYKNDFYVGSIMNHTYTSGLHFDLFKKHFNIATLENEMKPANLAPISKIGEYRWKTADTMVNLLLENKFKIHGHVLVWHEQSPGWMTQGTEEEVRNNMINHIKIVMDHYKGKVISWDVVNEAMSDNIRDPANWKDCLRDNSNWNKVLGADYIELAFRTARECDPDILLFYNDYNLNNQNKAIAVRNMVKDINDRYKAEGNSRNLIDGVGMQSHYGVYLNVNDVRISLERFIDAGVVIAISELDIESRQTSPREWRTGGNSKLPDDIAQKQAEIYAELFMLYKEHSKHITQVIMWGADDRTSWKSAGNPCLFDGNLNPKPAFYAVLNPKKFLKR